MEGGTMRVIYNAAKVIADHYGLEPGDSLTVTVNAAGHPQVSYTRRLTKELVEAENASDHPWREWVGPEENKRDA
jgi:hypothetical protein